MIAHKTKKNDFRFTVNTRIYKNNFIKFEMDSEKDNKNFKHDQKC